MHYVFEELALDAKRRELRRGDRILAIEPKVFDLLLYLIANRDRVVSKDDPIEAVWAGRIVSESALTTCINAARVAIGDSGEAQRLIKTLPRRGFRFVGTVREQAASNGLSPSGATDELREDLALPDRPSLAVLPFVNIGGDPEQDYFADGIVEEMITGLSRLRSLFVIARNSSFTFKERSVDVKEIGRELGVRYVLQGSVRKAAGRLRITAQLVDALSGTNLWADRFEGVVNDVFNLQDQITASVIAAIAPQVERAEISRVQRKTTESLDAYDIYLRGMAAYHQRTREATEVALRNFYRAIELGPDLAAAYAMAAMTYGLRKSRGWLEREDEITESRRPARQAANIAPDDAVTLGFAGYALAQAARELDDGAGLIERALHLNPNLGSVLLASGWVKVWQGEPEPAIQHLAQAMRLSPLDPHMYMMQAAMAHAHFFVGNFEDAALWAQKALREQREGLPILRIAAASFAMSSRPVDARKAVTRLLQLDPTLRVSNFQSTLGPYRHASYVTQYGDALRRAGLLD